MKKDAHMSAVGKKYEKYVVTSAGDPDPDTDPQDSHVFWPPGSGSFSQRCGSGSGSLRITFEHKIVAKIC
jgi:hypothetical protein